MRFRVLPLVMVLGLAALPVSARAADEAPPTVIVRLRSLDGLMTDAKYLAGLAGLGEQAKQVDGLIQVFVGEKGLKGIDIKRPIGVYGRVGQQILDSSGVVMVPIGDEQTLLDWLDGLALNPEKGDDGVYTVQPQNSPVPIYFRFANKYAYVTFHDKGAIDKGRLLDPSKVFAPGETALLSVAFRLDQVPEALKQIALGRMELELANMMDQAPPRETEPQKKLRKQLLREIGDNLAQVIKGGGELSLKLDVDRNKQDLSLELSLSGKAGSKLAAAIAGLDKGQSLFAGGLGGNSAMNLLLHAGLPAALRQALDPVIDESIATALEKEADAAKREQAATLLKALTPTLKAGEVDLAFSLRGPSKDNHYAVVVGLKLENGQAIDKAVRNFVRSLPENDRAAIKVDAESAGTYKIHRVDAQAMYDPQAKKVFGENPIYFAIRSDALVLSVGAGGLEALKDVLTAPPKTGPTLRFEASLNRLSTAMEETPGGKQAGLAAKAAFGDGSKGNDLIRLSLEGGDALKLRVGVKASVVKFIAAMNPNGGLFKKVEDQ